jgi:site-specific DNA recombinase
LYGSGNYSIRTVSEQLAKEGFLSSKGTPLANNMVDNILNNPFYYGQMRIKGTLYPHKYESLISQDLFDKCQKIKKGWKKKPFKYAAKPFIFRGLIKCADCGCTITPESKKNGRLTYYSCTNGKRICKRTYVPEETILEPVYEALKGIQLPDQLIHEVTEALRTTGQSEAEFHRKSMKSLRDEYDRIEKRVMKMYDDKLDGSITEEMYDKKLSEYKNRQSDLHIKMQAHSDADEEFYVTANTVLNLAQRAKEIFEGSEVMEKRQLLNYLLQNAELKDRKLTFELRKPFNYLYEFNSQKRKKTSHTTDHPFWLRGWDDVRTSLMPDSFEVVKGW